jgi:CheY-like chemotaxis protein
MASGGQTMLGRLLVSYAMITEFDLEEALQKQETSQEPLGQILVAMDRLAEGDLEIALRAQTRLRGRGGKVRPHVLVIDDDPEVGAVVEEILAGAGYSVGIAQSESEAMAAMTARDATLPSLLVLEMELSRRSGMELLASLRELTYHTIPVVILTGHSHLEDDLAEQGAGVRAFLTKPVSARRLVEVVDQILGQAVALP